jgi:hypothetical protein
MRKFLTIIAAALLLPVPANADFSVSKPKPAKPAPKATAKPAPARAVAKPKHRPPVERRQVVVPPKPVPQLPGIEPMVVRDAIVAAGYSAVLTANPADASQKIAVTVGNSGWTARLKECASTNRCKLLEFAFTWQVPNDANVCSSWKYYITKDETGASGLPMCFTVPPSGKQLELLLSSGQAPYAGMDNAPPADAKQRIAGMVKVWTTYVGRLTEARDIASKKCPKKKNKCW